MGRRPPLFLDVGFLLALVVAVTGKGILFPGSPIRESKDSCNLPSGATGTCKNINDCQVSAQNMDYQPPKICGYEGKVAVVCCPQDGCMDISLRCASNAFQCNTNSYVLGRCKKTCNLCENGSKPEPVRLTDISAPNINFKCGVGYTTYSRPARSSSLQSVPGNTGFGRRRRRGLAPPPPSHWESYGPPCLNGPYDSLGGTRVENNKYPWMAILGQDKAGSNTTWFCGGVLINRRWVLTAAHCTNTHNPTVVRLGEHDFSKDYEGDHDDFTVAEVLFHDGYKPPQAYHDISLIKLSTPIKIRKEMSPVCLPWGHEADLPLVGKTVTVSGWGTTRYFRGPISPFLNEIDVTVLPTDVCASGYSTVSDFPFNYPQQLGEETLCIGDNSNQTLVKDSCSGDSGGPAVLKRDERFTVVGIVSAGYGCGKRRQPGLYVAVQHPEHLAWIKRVAFSTCDSLCVNGTCNPSIGCVCSVGWSGEFCDTPICDLPCLRGQCVSPNVCQCEFRWSGSQCQHPNCINGNSPDSLSCMCEPGWQDDLCYTPICDHSCGQGRCSRPNFCSCDCPWFGDQCEHLWCDHGNYSDGLTCTCDVGWSGRLCDIIICANGIEYGSEYGNSRCRCVAGWTGTRCDIVKCTNGNSSDDLTCTCDVGWSGTLCVVAICNPPCVNGNCVAPDQCECNGPHNFYTDVLKWSGDLCHCDYGRHGDQCQHRLQCHDFEDHFYMGNQCFFITKDPDSWDGARGWCKKLGGFLAEPNNLPNFQKAARDNSTYFGRDLLVWVGGRKEKDNIWIWSSDGTKVGNSENWSPAEHRYSDESNDCLGYDRVIDNFKDFNCEGRTYFVCEIRLQ